MPIGCESEECGCGERVSPSPQPSPTRGEGALRQLTGSHDATGGKHGASASYKTPPPLVGGGWGEGESAYLAVTHDYERQ